MYRKKESILKDLEVFPFNFLKPADLFRLGIFFNHAQIINAKYHGLPYIRRKVNILYPKDDLIEFIQERYTREKRWWLPPGSLLRKRKYKRESQ